MITKGLLFCDFVVKVISRCAQIIPIEDRKLPPGDFSGLIKLEYILLSPKDQSCWQISSTVIKLWCLKGKSNFNVGAEIRNRSGKIEFPIGRLASSYLNETWQKSHFLSKTSEHFHGLSSVNIIIYLLTTYIQHFGEWVFSGTPQSNVMTKSHFLPISRL